MYRRLVASNINDNGSATSETSPNQKPGSQSLRASAHLQLPSTNSHARPTFNGELYDSLCRGIRLPEYERPPGIRKRYEHCYFANVGNDLRAILTPSRVEMVFNEPPILLLRGVISRKEIDHIKKLASPLVSTFHNSHVLSFPPHAHTFPMNSLYSSVGGIAC